MGHSMPYKSILAQRVITLERTDGKAPTRVQIMRDGNLGWLGLEEMELDAKSAQNVIDHFEKAGVDLPIDYHHATKKQEEGQIAEAPAAGWIKAGSLEYIPGDGLYGNVEWTDKATRQIEAEEYKYLSPVVLSDEETDEIVFLHSAALTNRPRTTDQIELLKAAELLVAATSQGDSIMATTKKLKAVAAQEDMVEPAPMPAVDETQKLLSDLIAELQTVGVTIADEAPLAEVLLATIEAVKGGTVEPAEAATEEVAADAATAPVATPAAEPVAQLPIKAAESGESAEICALRIEAARSTELSARLKVLEDERKAGRVNALVDAELTRGTLHPDNVKMVAAARNLADTDEAKFTALFASMEPIVAPGRLVSPTASDKKESQKTDRAKLIAAAREEFETTGAAKSGAKLRHYVDVKLEDAGEADQNEAEVKALEGVPV